jgi:hypothetical protein
MLPEKLLQSLMPKQPKKPEVAKQDTFWDKYGYIVQRAAIVAFTSTIAAYVARLL